MSTFPLALTNVNCPLIFIPFSFADNVLYFSDGSAYAGVYTESPQAGAKSEAVVPKLPREKRAGIELAPLGRAT